MFYLDDADMRLIAKRRGEHMRLGFALQLTTVRYLGTFLTDPLDVPPLVLEHLAGQLRISDPACVARYAERRTTPLEHRDEIKAEGGLREFAEAEDEFTAWVHARAWNTGDGPKTIFADGVKWLRENAVLLPGVTTAARLVSRVRDETLDERYATLAGLPGPYLAARLEGLVAGPDGARYSELELWRRGPSKPTGRSLERGLTRVAEVSGTGIGRLDLQAHVPRRGRRRPGYPPGPRQTAPPRCASSTPTCPGCTPPPPTMRRWPHHWSGSSGSRTAPKGCSARTACYGCCAATWPMAGGPGRAPPISHSPMQPAEAHPLGVRHFRHIGGGPGPTGDRSVTWNLWRCITHQLHATEGPGWKDTLWIALPGTRGLDTDRAWLRRGGTADRRCPP
jgi:hypothetical protein